MAQVGAAIQAHYETISSLAAVGADWDELRAAAQPKPVDPRRGEPLLRPSDILGAVRKIGPEAAPEFYRALAGEKDTEGRQEAAVRLAEGDREDLQKNLAVLKPPG